MIKKSVIAILAMIAAAGLVFTAYGGNGIIIPQIPMIWKNSKIIMLMPTMLKAVQIQVLQQQ